MQNALSTTLTQGLRDLVVLQNFTRYVQRQIVGIEQAFHKAQISRHELLSVIHNEYALYIQLQTVALLSVPQVKRRFAWNIQEAGVFRFTFHFIVRPGHRVSKIVGDVLVELSVFFVGDFRLVACPQCRRFVYGFPFTWLTRDFLTVRPFGLFYRRFPHSYRNTDMVGVFADNRTQTPVIGKLFFIIAQEQRNFSAARLFVDVTDGKVTFTGRGPLNTLISWLTGSPCANNNFVCNDKR